MNILLLRLEIGDPGGKSKGHYGVMPPRMFEPSSSMLSLSSGTLVVLGCNGMPGASTKLITTYRRGYRLTIGYAGVRMI